MDLPDAFLHVENDQDLITFLRARLAELMTMIAPHTYQKYITIVKVQKVLYGMLKSALLLHKKLRSDLDSVGFKVNP